MSRTESVENVLNSLGESHLAPLDGRRCCFTHQDRYPICEYRPGLRPKQRNDLIPIHMRDSRIRNCCDDRVVQFIVSHMSALLIALENRGLNPGVGVEDDNLRYIGILHQTGQFDSLPDVPGPQVRADDRMYFS